MQQQDVFNPLAGLDEEDDFEFGDAVVSCDGSRGGNNGGLQRSLVVEDDTSAEAGEAGSEPRKSIEGVAQGKKVSSPGHKDEDLSTRENANTIGFLTSDAVVHVMDHAEKAISGETMDMA